MHDFLQSFRPDQVSTAGGPASRRAVPFRGDCRWGIMRSFDEDTVPFSAFRPSPMKPNRRKRGSAKPSTLNS
jgi:hypothetical protein